MRRVARICLPGCWPVIVTASLSHWKRNGTQHGAKSRPQVAAASLVRLSLHPTSPSSGWRIWAYFRGGYAFFVDLYIDRRTDRRASEVVRR
jgi:hypothetical protein